MADIMYFNLREARPNEYILELFGNLHISAVDTVYLFNKHTVTALLALLQAGTAGSHVVIDLAQLRLIDSSGINALKDVQIRVKSMGGRVTIRGLKGQPHFYFRILRLDREFAIEN